MIVAVMMILLPGLLQAFEYKSNRLYKEHAADQDISQFIRKSLQNSGDLQELFALGEQDYNKFVDSKILQDYSSYFDGVSTGQSDRFYGANADVATEILKIHDQAVAYISPSIREKFEPKLHAVLFDILNNSSKNIEKINEYTYHVSSSDSSFSDTAADKILNYVVLHRKLNFQIYHVLEDMINTKNYKPSVMQFILDNFTITQKVAGVDAIDQGDLSPLMKACQDASEQALLKVKFLATCKADVNFKIQLGYTPLMYACQNSGSQAFNIVQYLVEKGADLNVKTKFGMIPLMYACENTGPQAFDIVRYLFAKGANVNIQDQFGYTLLMRACDNRGPQAFDIVRYLVENGVNVNFQDLFGSTALIYACRNTGPQALNIVHYLLDCGANRNIRTSSGVTAFGCACTQKIKDILKNYQSKASSYA